MAGWQLHLLQSTLSLNRVNQLPTKRRTFHLQLDPLTSYTDSKLRCRYRFGRDAIDYIVGLVADDIMPETNRNHAVSVEMQVLITLRYLASGSFLQVIGDIFRLRQISSQPSCTSCHTGLICKGWEFRQISVNESWKRRNKARSFSCWWISVCHWLYRWYSCENNSPSRKWARLREPQRLSLDQCAGNLQPSR